MEANKQVQEQKDKIELQLPYQSTAVRNFSRSSTPDDICPHGTCVASMWNSWELRLARSSASSTSSMDFALDWSCKFQALQIKASESRRRPFYYKNNNKKKMYKNEVSLLKQNCQ